MSNLIKVVLLQFSSSALTGSFQNFGSALTKPAIKLNFYNNSTVDVYITDGTSNWQIPSKGAWFGDESFQNGPSQGPRIYEPMGAQFQVKQVTGAGAGTNDIIAHIVMER